MAQQVNLPGYSPRCPFNAERDARRLQIPSLKSLVRPYSESNPSLHQLRWPSGTAQMAEWYGASVSLAVESGQTNDFKIGVHSFPA